MDFAKPENARLINTLRILSVMRSGDELSCAELSRRLLINKVTVGEIVKKLIAEGLVRETGKIIPVSGRPATRIEIAWNSGCVIALSDEGKGVKIAQCDLAGRIIRMERFPKGSSVETTRENLMAAFLRLTRGNGIKIWGCVVTSDSNWSWLKDEVPFSVAECGRVECRVASELSRSGLPLEGTLFIELDENVRALFHTKDDDLYLPSFGSITTRRGSRLEDLWSMERIRKDWPDARRGTIFEDEELSARMKADLPELDSAIEKAREILRPKYVMLMGALSDMSDRHYAALNEMTKDIVVFKSLSGDGGALEGAAIKALDEFFYRTDLLKKLRELEKL